MEQKEEQLKIKNELLSLEKKASFRLKVLIVILVLLASIGLYALHQQNKMKRLLFDKESDKEKNATMLEFKNKELTANALQIIEKKKAVEELLGYVKSKSLDKHNELKRKFKQINKKIWDDFHLCFTQTNNSFYKQLLNLHPNLTPTDLKHCALLKLNFDSKEMSHLLGISVNSVPMARSRIRKKLGLKREDSLSHFLSKI